MLPPEALTSLLTTFPILPDRRISATLRYKGATRPCKPTTDRTPFSAASVVSSPAIAAFSANGHSTNTSFPAAMLGRVVTSCLSTRVVHTTS